MTDFHISGVSRLLGKAFEGQFRVYNEFVEGFSFIFEKPPLLKVKYRKVETRTAGNDVLNDCLYGTGTYLKLIVE
jgi:hypothetical protein